MKLGHNSLERNPYSGMSSVNGTQKNIEPILGSIKGI